MLELCTANSGSFLFAEKVKCVRNLYLAFFSGDPSLVGYLHPMTAAIKI